MKLLITTTLILATILPATLFFSQVSAVSVLNSVCTNAANHGETPTICTGDDSAPGTANPAYVILRVIIDILSLVIGIASVIVIVVQGMRFILSNGDPQTISSARSGIIYACVGLVVAALAQVLVVFVLNKLGS